MATMYIVPAYRLEVTSSTNDAQIEIFKRVAIATKARSVCVEIIGTIIGHNHWAIPYTQPNKVE